MNLRTRSLRQRFSAPKVYDVQSQTCTIIIIYTYTYNIFFFIYNVYVYIIRICIHNTTTLSPWDEKGGGWKRITVHTFNIHIYEHVYIFVYYHINIIKDVIIGGAFRDGTVARLSGFAKFSWAVSGGGAVGRGRKFHRRLCRTKTKHYPVERRRSY